MKQELPSQIVQKLCGPVNNVLASVGMLCEFLGELTNSLASFALMTWPDYATEMFPETSGNIRRASPEWFGF